MFSHSFDRCLAEFEMRSASFDRSLMEYREKNPTSTVDDFNICHALYTMCLEIKDLKDKVDTLSNKDSNA